MFAILKLMKLITLNTWGGRIKDALGEFLDSRSDADILLFQEVYKSRFDNDHVHVVGFTPDFTLFDTISRSLVQHNGHFCQVLKESYGIAAFVDKKVEIGEKGEMLVSFRDWNDVSDLHNRDHIRKLQWFEVFINGKKILIANAHLTHRPEGKEDSPKRINQSELIVKFLSMFDCPKVLAGDFNLLPDTEGIRMIEAAGMRNLVKEFGVTSTRTEMYKKPLKFADYVFVSTEVKVKDFKVLPDVVSDHAPLFLDFEVA